MNAARSFWLLLDARERRGCVVLLGLAVTMALGTVAGIAAVMPFFAVLADPALMDRHAALAWLHAHTGHLSARGFLLLLGAGFVGLLLVSSAINLLGSAAMTRFAHRVGDHVRIRLFGSYLARDYPFHVRRGMAVLAGNVLHQADRVTGMVHAAAMVICNLLTTGLIFFSIAVVDAGMSLLVLLSCGLAYLLLYVIARRRLLANGRLQTELGAERVAVVEQGLTGIKDVLLSQSQDTFSTRFARASREISRTAAHTQLVGLAPRYLLECVSGVALVGAALALSARAPRGEWLATLTFVGFSAYRLLPALQQLYFSLVTLRAGQSALESVVADLAVPAAVPEPRPAEADLRRECAAVELVDVGFRHAADLPGVLEHASLRIEAGSVVAFTGPNGSGKTTTADLLLGLLTPDTGRIEVGGVALDAGTRESWKRSLACVTQHVFLLDASVRENITLGATARDDEARLHEAVRRAGARELIDSLPRHFEERLADRGARLSGGQRQLIGLARALYRRPSFLVLDEVDASLDEESTARLATVLRGLRGLCTVIVITHHQRLLEVCEGRFEFGAGVVRRIDAPRDDLALARRLRSTP